MKSNIAKITNKIKENKFYIISFAVAYILLFLIMNKVVMYADDFGLDLQSKASFFKIIQNSVVHYFNWGGGLTPLIVNLLFKIGFNAWKFLNTLLITLMFYLIAKTISKNKKQFIISFIIEWLLFYSISINIVRECIYWLDGSMAYVVTTFELFMFIYMIYTRFVLKKDKKYDVFLLPIVGLFSGWSAAQTSGATLIITIFFIIWYKFIKHNKINKKFLLLVIAALIGCSIFFLSPGNSARMNTLGEFSRFGIIDKVLYKIEDASNLTFNFKQYSFNTMPLFIYIFSYLVLFLSLSQLKTVNNKKEKIILVISSIIQVLFLFSTIAIIYLNSETLFNYTFKFVNLYELKITNQLSIINFIPYFILILFLLSNLATIIIHSKKEKNILLLLLFLNIYISQFSMVLAPYTPYRTCFTAIAFLIFAIIYLINYLYKQKTDFESIVPIILLYININISIIMFIFMNALLKKEYSKKILLILAIMPILYFAVVNYKILYKNYNENKIIFNYNIDKLKEYKKGDNVIYLRRFNDEMYAFTPLVGTEWVEKDVKKYFSIPEDIMLKYEGE